mgnify:CR=1 FL=1
MLTTLLIFACIVASEIIGVCFLAWRLELQDRKELMETPVQLIGGPHDGTYIPWPVRTERRVVMIPVDGGSHYSGYRRESPSRAVFVLASVASEKCLEACGEQKGVKQ